MIVRVKHSCFNEFCHVKNTPWIPSTLIESRLLFHRKHDRKCLIALKLYIMRLFGYLLYLQYAGSVTGLGTEIGIGELSSNPDPVYCVQFSTKALKKVFVSSILIQKV